MPDAECTDDDEGRNDEKVEEELEPTLKYQRLGGSCPSILARDAASCLAAHNKFMALGTVSGAVHVLDLAGNEIRRFTPHSAAVLDVCIDTTGEFVGSCSQDGTVVVSSLFGGDSSTHWYHRPVHAIALDPDYAARRTFATGGLADQLVINSRGWFGSKDSVVHSGEGPIQTIRIAGHMLAWANDHGVKVYDAQHAKRVSYIARTPGSPPPRLFRCHLRWESPSELIIGCADTIKIGRIREREPAPGVVSSAGVAPTSVGGPMGGALSAFHGACAGVGAGGDGSGSGGGMYMEIVTMIQTDFYICGLAGVRLRVESGVPKHDVLCLAYVCEPQDEDKYGPGGAPPGGAQRPELRLVSRQNEEYFADALSMEGFEDRRANSYSLVLPPPTTAMTQASSEAAHVLPTRQALQARSSVEGAAGALAATGQCMHASYAAGSSGPSVVDDADAAAMLPELTAYVVSPRDVIVARSRDWDDRVGWLLERKRTAEALSLATRHADRLREHRVIDIAELQIGALLSSGKAAEAAELCVAHLGASAELWARWLRAFCASGALQHICHHVPISQPQLPPEAYELALVAAISSTASRGGKADDHDKGGEAEEGARGGYRSGDGESGKGGKSSESEAGGSMSPGSQLLHLLRRWPHSLYRPAVVQRAVLEEVRRLPGGLVGQPRLLESMALLHCAANQHEAALSLLLRLPPHETDVFAFVELHSLQSFCRDKLVALSRHSWERTLALALRYTEAIPPSDVISQLEVADESKLLSYLHELFLCDVHLGGAYHGRQLSLYGKYAPQQLLAFLKGSPHYPLELALEVCREHGLVEEQVYVLGRMGAHREALALMLGSLQDIKGAVDFVRQSRDPELWQALLTHAMPSPPLLEALLRHVSEEPLRTLDTLTLVQQLPQSTEIRDLPQYLAALLAQANAKLELTRAALNVAHADHAALLRERHRLVQLGTPISVDELMRQRSAPPAPPAQE